MGVSCHSTCGTLKNLHCSMDMSAQYRSNFGALYRLWWRINMNEKLSNMIKNNRQTQKLCLYIRLVILYLDAKRETNLVSDNDISLHCRAIGRLLCNISSSRECYPLLDKSPNASEDIFWHGGIYFYHVRKQLCSHLYYSILLIVCFVSTSREY